MDRVNHTPPEVIHDAVEDIDEGMSLLHTVISSGDARVPFEVLKCIAERASSTGADDSDAGNVGDASGEEVVLAAASILASSADFFIKSSPPRYL